MKTFEFDNTKIHYRVSGNGDPVLFLHGFLENHSMWNSIAPEIAALGFRVYQIDLPCHGKSRYKGEICSMTHMANILHQLCISENIENANVFGHSMGGYVGLELLKLRPIKLTLVHSNFWNDPHEKKKDRDRVVSIVRENKFRLINEAIPNLFATENREECESSITELIKAAGLLPANEIIATTRGMRDRDDNSALLKHNSISIIQGDSDQIVKTEKLNEELKKSAIHPEVYHIKKCGHMSIWECPEELINCLKLIVFK